MGVMDRLVLSDSAWERGAVYQAISLRLGEKVFSSDLSVEKGLLRFPIIGPPMKGPTGEVASQPYVTLTDAMAAKRISVLVPMKDASGVVFTFSGDNERFWQAAEACRDSYRS